MRSQWIEHFRDDDHELLGWIEPVGPEFHVFNLLGQKVLVTEDWFEAETVLDNLGISYLADNYTLKLDDGHKEVVLVSVSPDGITAKTNNYNDITADQEFFDLPFPAPSTLQPAEA